MWCPITWPHVGCQPSASRSCPAEVGGVGSLSREKGTGEKSTPIWNCGKCWYLALDAATVPDKLEYSHLRLESCYFPLCLEISVCSFPEEARSAYCYQQMGPWPFCMNQPHHNSGKITHFRSIPLVQKALYFLSCTQCINRAKPKDCPRHKGGLQRHRV